MSVTKKNKDNKLSVIEAEAINSLKNKIARITEHKKELQQEYEDLFNELKDAREELNKTKKFCDEASIDFQSAEKARNDIDIQFRHLSQLKHDKDKEIKELQELHANLEDQVEEIHHKEERFKHQTETEISDVHREKNALEIQARFFGRKLEDDRRELQTQFYEAKQELKRNYRREIDSRKQKYDLQISALERKTKADISELKEKLDKKIEKMSSDNYNTRTQIELTKQILLKRDDEISRIEKAHQREQQNSEVSGTTRIDWLPADAREAPSVSQEAKSLERKIEQLRDKLIAAGEELLLAKRQKSAADRQVKELRKDLDEQDLLYRRLEASKSDIERRFQKRQDQIDDQIDRKTRQTESDFFVQRRKLEHTLDDSDETLTSLKREIAELMGRLNDTKVNASKTVNKMAQKLDRERGKFVQVEREMGSYVSEVLECNRQMGDVSERISFLEKEGSRYKNQVEILRRQLEKAQEKNHKLEQSIRKSESTPIKA